MGAVLAARAAGRPGFLAGDMTALGKTRSVWSAILAMLEPEVLIICPKDGLPEWRRTIALASPSGKRVTLTNYEHTTGCWAPPGLVAGA